MDVNSYHLANLSLANVKLPTGELRRKSEDDERAMRSFMRVSLNTHLSYLPLTAPPSLLADKCLSTVKAL